MHKFCRIILCLVISQFVLHSCELFNHILPIYLTDIWFVNIDWYKIYISDNNIYFAEVYIWMVFIEPRCVIQNMGES